MAVEEPPLAVAATDGVRLILDNGRELVDGMASWWTACHGYNHPHVVKAINDQAGTMPHIMFGGLVHEGALRLARRLTDMTPGDLGRVFFSDSGSVAVEVALKMALQYWVNIGEPARTRFVCFKGGYHGDTIGAMGVSDAEAGFHANFKGAMVEQMITDLPRDADTRAAFAALIDEKGPEIAGIIIEPLVQGAGGMVFHDAATLAFVAQQAQARGIPVIADEIFTGFGRTGHMFACEQAQVVPDIMCLSKGLTGGAIGLGATMARPHIFGAFLGESLSAAFMHGPTYMANPIACAAANASLDLFESEPRLDQVSRIEAGLKRGLEPCRGLSGVADVRVMGAIGVVELIDLPLERLYRLRRAFIERGLWVRPFGRIIYLTPAFVMADTDLEALSSGIKEVLTAN
jgi:adenosylmethionine-8-amino-7-oxononanoate aminotransferase